MIDLRSDTVTRPTAAMREAMLRAELGDDVLDHDPTTAALEARAAELLGQEAGLFVASGTMGNLVATLTHTHPGDEVILERNHHVYHFENNGLSALAGCLPLVLDGERGHLTAAQVQALVADLLPRGPRPKLLWLENTANVAGGTVMNVAATEAICAVAHEAGLKVHLDGARLFHAAVALGAPAAKLAGSCDSVSICLSKALCCPAGSVLCGPSDWIARARDVRRMVGGGMRQNGVLAAAGLVALETMIDRLAEDHANARRLADRLAALPDAEVDPDAVETNIVWFRHPDLDWPARCKAAGVWFLGFGAGRCRVVAHHDVTADDVQRAADVMAACLR